jgi:hypothetical protein
MHTRRFSRGYDKSSQLAPYGCFPHRAIGCSALDRLGKWGLAAPRHSGDQLNVNVIIAISSLIGCGKDETSVTECVSYEGVAAVVRLLREVMARRGQALGATVSYTSLQFFELQHLSCRNCQFHDQESSAPQLFSQLPSFHHDRRCLQP